MSAPQMPQRPHPAYTTDDGRPIVSKIECEVPVGEAADLLIKPLEQAIALAGGLGPWGGSGRSVLIKPNFNSPDPMPASADVEFIAAVVHILREAGVDELAVGESAGLPWHPTREVLTKTGLLQRMSELDVPVIIFDEHDWVEIDLAARGARYLPRIGVPAALAQYDSLLFLPNLKTHRLARFTMSLKLAVGLMRPEERKALHAEYLEEKVAEIALAVRPDFTILDGRRAFVTRGPANGDLVEPRLILAGGDQVSVDVEAVKVLQSYPAENRLQGDAWELPQIAVAQSLGLGPKGRRYELREG